MREFGGWKGLIQKENSKGTDILNFNKSQDKLSEFD